jgi:hypothetical protein
MITFAKPYRVTFTRNQAFEFANFCMQANSLGDVIREARRIANRLRGSKRKRNTWKYCFYRFADMLERGELPHCIFELKGNTKLPFAAFSTLPIVTCPGAGACGGIDQLSGKPDLAEAYCYSLRAWRYPCAFLRQAMNTLLLRFNRRAIIQAFQALPNAITLRLYVDGDFDSEQTALFWFNLLRQRNDIECYGYSKSWHILLALANRVPSNYVLNISSGSLFDHDSELKARMLALPFVRGEFIAVQIDGKHPRGFARFKSADYHRAVRAAADSIGVGKVFSCPGQCGSCTGSGHACGSKRDDGRFLVPITIAIGVH